MGVYTAVKGHKIISLDGDNWTMADGSEIVWDELECVLCGQRSNDCSSCSMTEHDPCIGHIDANLKGLCCGHGDLYYAYISYQDGRDYRGAGAINHMAKEYGIEFPSDLTESSD